jgi:hypothetical protein
VTKEVDVPRAVARFSFQRCKQLSGTDIRRIRGHVDHWSGLQVRARCANEITDRKKRLPITVVRKAFRKKTKEAP